MPEYYKCELCKRTYENGWSHAEAVAEYEANFGEKYDTETTGIVCDSCYPILEAAASGASEEEIQRMMRIREAEIKAEDSPDAVLN